MSPWRCGFLFGALLLTAAVSGLRAADTAQPAADPPLMPPAGKKLDPWKLPADGLIVVTPDQLQELFDAWLRKGKGKTSPASCRLTDCEVKEGFISFKAEFGFHAERPDQVFALACRQARARAAMQNNDRTPMLSSDADDGYLVQVEKPGEYTVTLDLSLPLSQRPGGGRGFELDLPRAVVTTLDLNLPPGARAPRLNGKDLNETSLTFENGQLMGPIGAADKLDLTWQGQPPAGIGPLQTVRGRVTVRVEDDWMHTDAELVLHAQGGPVKSWVVVVPSGFEVKASPADQQRVQIERQEAPGDVRCTVHVNGKNDDDVTLTATAHVSLADGKRKAVGPFLVPAASRQSGEVLVRASGPDAQLVLLPNADLTPRDLTEAERQADPKLTAAYEYGAAPANAPWLEVEPASAHGAVKTQAAYALALGRTGPGGALEWQATTTLTAAPSAGAAVGWLDVQLPDDCEVLPLSALPEGVKIGPADMADPHLVRIQLNGAATSPFTVSFKVRYASADVLPVPPSGQKSFPLPRPAGSRADRVVPIDVTVPDEVELAPPADADVKEPHHVSWRSAKAPPQALVSWQPYTPETRVSSVIDLTFHGQLVEVKHEMHLHFPRTAPKQLTLKTPAALGASLQVIGGPQLDDAPAGAEMRTLKLGAGQDQVVTLKYSFALAPRSSPLAPAPAPLATVDKAKEGDARVRVWCGPGRLPAAPGGDWSEMDIEEVKDIPKLPVLVLASNRPDAPLTLAFTDPSATGGSQASVLVDRALYRAALEGDAWEIRATYLLRQPADDHLDVELPDAPSALRLRATLDGREVDPETVEQPDANGGVRHIARFRLGGDLFLKPAVLDITCKLSVRGGLRNTLIPPRLVGDSGQAPTRWRLTLPPDFVVLAPENDAALRWTVGLHGWLPAPRLAVADDDLEQWFAGADVSSWPKGAAAAPSLVCWQGAGQPLTIVYLPEWAWLAVCSVPLVLIGLLLFRLARRSYVGSRWAGFFFWLLVVLLAAALGGAWLFYPTIFYAIAFGCEPGVPVLVLVLLFQAAMLERYRRRIVFLPNFRRARAGSSLVRANGSQRSASEPSTVDAPRPSSSQQPA